MENEGSKPFHWRLRKILHRTRIYSLMCFVLAILLVLSACDAEEPREEGEPPVEEPVEIPERPADGSNAVWEVEPYDEPVPPLPVLAETLREDESGRPIVTNPGDILVLVNKNRNLPPDYVPEDLTQPDIPFPFEGAMPRKLMRAPAAEALEGLIAAAREDGHVVYGSSGYRSYATQEAIFQGNVRRRGEEEANRFSARPGQSEHQTGLAMDVTSAAVGYALVQRFGETPEGQWIAENAHRFGFIVRYPEGAEDITGYAYEPWHLRYVGTRHAERIYEAGITFEEYMENR